MLSREQYRCPAFVGILFLIVFMIGANAPVFGQLTSDDIARLKEQGEKEGWTFIVKENEATQYPLSQITGLKVPDDWRQNAKVYSPKIDPATLPPSYDWRSITAMPPIRNQGGCGSCWAFATVGAMECAIKIYDDTVVNLSEQWLVSCNNRGWGCDGGWLAFDFFQWDSDPCNGIGAIAETSFPYVAADVACSCPYEHLYRIDSWGFVDGEWVIPTPEAMKQAIMEYGPIAVCVYANSAFQAYGGGIFNACENQWINHAVVLVGWDDTQGPGGVWIMRNSWGQSWGESGYMRIPYGCCEIGYGAAWMDYSGVRLSGTPTFGPAPLAVDFTGVCGRTVNSWLWDFGDGSGSDMQNCAHSYQPGMYNVTLTVQTPTKPYQALRVDYVSVYADTLNGGTLNIEPRQKIRVDVYGRNCLPLKEMTIPFTWGGPFALTLDSVSTAGLRTDSMETRQYINFDPSNRRATYFMRASASGGPQTLAAGAGPVLSIFLTAPGLLYGGPHTMSFAGYGNYSPTFLAEAGSYTPILYDAVLNRCRPGDVDGNSIGPDISDLSYLVDFLFMGGPQPPSAPSANVDGQGQVDISDLTYLAEYLFMGGPAPQACS
ncbi:MAG: C1 family peptidase [Candidatus Zixiibacteriota bacterium]